MCQSQNPRHFSKCGCNEEFIGFDDSGYYNGLGATGLQTGISAGGAVGGAAIGTFIGGPIGTVVGAAIGVAASAISSLFTPDYKKIYATNDVNAIAAQMQKNLDGWKALPVSAKVPAVQQFFETNYNNLWANLVKECSDPSLGTAGQNCISDRQPGGKYPFADYYLSQIENDNSVHTQTSSVTFQDPLTGTSITVNPDPISSASGLLSNFTSQGTTGYVELGLGALVLVLLLRKL